MVSPLARWTAQTLIDPSSGTRSPTANYTPIESALPIADKAVSEFILQRQAITRFVRDALQSAVDKQKEKCRQTWQEEHAKVQKR